MVGLAATSLQRREVGAVAGVLGEMTDALKRPIRLGLASLIGRIGGRPCSASSGANDDRIDRLGRRLRHRVGVAACGPPGAANRRPSRLQRRQVPGMVTLRSRESASGPCDPGPQGMPCAASNDDPFSEPRYLNEVQVFRSRAASGQPGLLVGTASLHKRRRRPTRAHPGARMWERCGPVRARLCASDRICQRSRRTLRDWTHS